jgi:hypothetical protein
MPIASLRLSTASSIFARCANRSFARVSTSSSSVGICTAKSISSAGRRPTRPSSETATPFDSPICSSGSSRRIRHCTSRS